MCLIRMRRDEESVSQRWYGQLGQLPDKYTRWDMDIDRYSRWNSALYNYLLLSQRSQETHQPNP